MKKMACAILGALVATQFTGCKTHTGELVKSAPFNDMQKKVGEIGEEGGLAAVGIGQSTDMQISVEKAKLDGRKNLAQAITVKVENLQKDFVEDIGDPKDVSEINRMFSSATKVITSRELMGSMPQEQKITVDNGMYTSYVLMVVNPKVVADALEKQMVAEKTLYTRFKASEGFKELDKEIQRYEEFKKDMNTTIEKQQAEAKEEV